MPRKASQTDPSYGKRQRALRFDPKKRAEFVKKIKEGASIRAACRLVGVSKQTVWEWLKSGRAGARIEHTTFARQVDEAMETGTHDVRVRAYNSNEPKVMIEILKARDERFGDLDLRRQKLAAEIRQAEVETRAAEMRLEMQEILLDKARKGEDGQTSAFGLAALLDAPELSDGFKDELSRYIIAKGMVLIERARLTGPEPASA